MALSGSSSRADGGAWRPGPHPLTSQMPSCSQEVLVSQAPPGRGGPQVRPSRTLPQPPQDTVLAREGAALPSPLHCRLQASLCLSSAPTPALAHSRLQPLEGGCVQQTCPRAPPPSFSTAKRPRAQLVSGRPEPRTPWTPAVGVGSGPGPCPLREGGSSASERVPSSGFPTPPLGVSQPRRHPLPGADCHPEDLEPRSACSHGGRGGRSGQGQRGLTVGERRVALASRLRARHVGAPAPWPRGPTEDRGHSSACGRTRAQGDQCRSPACDQDQASGLTRIRAQPATRVRLREPGAGVWAAAEAGLVLLLFPSCQPLPVHSPQQLRVLRRGPALPQESSRGTWGPEKAPAGCLSPASPGWETVLAEGVTSGDNATWQNPDTTVRPP